MTKYALVTGSSAGIGRGIALRLLADGYHVITNGRSLERIQNAFKDVDAETRTRLHIAPADVSTSDGIARLIANISDISGGQLDVLVNNAGNLAFGLSFGSATWKDESFEHVLRTFITGPVYLLNAAVPLLEAAVKVNGSASVINITSVLGSRPAPNGSVPYSMAKAAIDALSKGAAVELAPKGIRVNSVAPGVTHSEIMASAGMTPEAVLGFEKKQASLIPLGRVGEPEDIANAVAYLADSKLSSWVTGVILTVDGGHSVRSVLE
jgi:3-oxoacyl-[acyl-carrier protein] reductase